MHLTPIDTTTYAHGKPAKAALKGAVNDDFAQILLDAKADDGADQTVQEEEVSAEVLDPTVLDSPKQTRHAVDDAHQQLTQPKLSDPIVVEPSASRPDDVDAHTVAHNDTAALSYSYGRPPVQPNEQSSYITQSSSQNTTQASAVQPQLTSGNAFAPRSKTTEPAATPPRPDSAQGNLNRISLSDDPTQSRTAHPSMTRDNTFIATPPPSNNATPALKNANASAVKDAVAEIGDGGDILMSESRNLIERPSMPSPAPTAAMTAAVTDQTLAQIRSQMAIVTLSRDGTQTELRLDPAELGRVRITLEIVDGHVTAHMSPDRPDVMDLLRRHADSLTADLLASGFDSAEMTFSEGGDEQQTGQSSPTTIDPTADTAEIKLSLPSDRLDLRL